MAVERLPVVLVNGGSAAGTEIVAAALQDHGRVVIIDSGTFGLGSIQTIMLMSNGAALKLTTAYFFTPSGQSIHDLGVIPDICVQDDQVQVIDEESRKQVAEGRLVCPKT